MPKKISLIQQIQTAAEGIPVEHLAAAADLPRSTVYRTLAGRGQLASAERVYQAALDLRKKGS